MWSLISTGWPGRVRRSQAAAAVGQHDDAGAGGDGRADAVHDGGDAAALVEVGAAEEDQRPAARRRPPSGPCRRGPRPPAAWKPGRSVTGSSAAVSPSMSAAGTQPEPITRATSWVSAPVSSRSRRGGLAGEGVGVGGRVAHGRDSSARRGAEAQAAASSARPWQRARTGAVAVRNATTSSTEPLTMPSTQRTATPRVSARAIRQCAAPAWLRSGVQDRGRGRGCCWR